MADDPRSALDTVRQDFRRLGTGAWVAIIILIALLVLAIVGVWYSGTDDLAAGVSGPGYLAMVFGVLFTLAVGVGLMGLIFFSSRRGYDETATRDPADQEPTDKDREG
jgi:hypothetical protein